MSTESQTTTLETVRTGKPREVTYGRSQLFTGGGGVDLDEIKHFIVLSAPSHDLRPG